MTTYLLDTNACIALINGSPPRVRKKLAHTIAQGHPVLVSSIATFELWYGVAKSQRREANAARVEAFIAGPVMLAEFDEDDAEEAGRVRAELEAVGTPIGAYDVLLAGQARRRGATLVTSNTREFKKVNGLDWQDWAAPR